MKTAGITATAATTFTSGAAGYGATESASPIRPVTASAGGADRTITANGLMAAFKPEDNDSDESITEEFAQ